MSKRSKPNDVLMAKNMRNLKVLTECLKKSRKDYDVGYYLGRIESIEHIQEELESNNGL